MNRLPRKNHRVLEDQVLEVDTRYLTLRWSSPRSDSGPGSHGPGEQALLEARLSQGSVA